MERERGSERVREVGVHPLLIPLHRQLFTQPKSQKHTPPPRHRSASADQRPASTTPPPPLVQGINTPHWLRRLWGRGHGLAVALFLSHSFTLSLLHSLIPPSLLLCILQAALCLIGVGSDRDGPICRIREEVFCVALVRFMQYYRSSKSQKDLGAQYSVVWGV